MNRRNTGRVTIILCLALFVLCLASCGGSPATPVSGRYHTEYESPNTGFTDFEFYDNGLVTIHLKDYGNAHGTYQAEKDHYRITITSQNEYRRLWENFGTNDPFDIDDFEIIVTPVDSNTVIVDIDAIKDNSSKASSSGYYILVNPESDSTTNDTEAPEQSSSLVSKEDGNTKPSSLLEQVSPGIDYVLTEYSADGSFGEGYTYTTTLKIGSWVKATDTEGISAAWRAVGGSGSAPDASSFIYLSNLSTRFSADTSIMAFGTVSFLDTTQGGFNISDTTYNPPADINGSLNTLYVDSCICYSNSNEYRHSYEIPNAYFLHFAPEMIGRNWGPVPFVICIADAISPNYPDGNPDIFSSTWWLYTSGGKNEFAIAPMWEID